jgi:dephospho-CoA kinase
VPTAHGTPIVGLTGAVAAGKSAALAAFERLGAATQSSDAVVHELLGTDRLRDMLVGRWGAEVAPGGTVDRAKVGEIVFAASEELEWLEGVLHPLVGERTAAWLAAVPAAARAAVLEVPLLFETGMEALFDATVAVVADDATRVERAGARGTADLAAREGRQLAQDEKAARADHVVPNDGTIEDLEASLDKVLADIEAAVGGRELG